MKVVIYATDGADLMKKYPLIEEYKGYYNEEGNWWRENSIVKEMNNDELIKVMSTLSSYSNLVIGYTSTSDYKNYGVAFFIEIYNDWRE